jgi:GT2 family glycosyltransferase
VLIDDGSTDDTESMVREQIQSLTVIKGDGNWWWAGSLQKGYEWLESKKLSLSDVILIINDDTEFGDDFLERGVTLLKKHEKTLLLAQCHSKQTQQLLDSGVHVNWKRLTFEQASSPEKVNCFSTRGLFLRARDFFEIGGFYPRILPHYLSDYEFTIRAKRMGFALVTNAELKLLLDESATGYHKFTPEYFLNFIAKYFSKKSAANPFDWTVFIALACPWPWKLINWLRVWVGATYWISKSILRSIKPPFRN